MPDLNPSQIEARDHLGSNLLILAGAGAGKTETTATRALNIAGIEGSSGLILITLLKRQCYHLKNVLNKCKVQIIMHLLVHFILYAGELSLEFGYRLGIDAS